MRENNEIEFSFLGMKGRANGRFAVTVFGSLCGLGILALLATMLARLL